MFAPGQTEACSSIEIVDDDIPEPEETFLVRLISTSNPRAVVGEPDTIITITDTDRTHTIHT